MAKRQFSTAELDLMRNILIRARERISNCQDEYCCQAISYSAVNTGNYQYGLYLQLWILEMLCADTGRPVCRWETLNAWLNRNHPLSDEAGYMYKIRRARVLWLTWMDDELRKEINQINLVK